MAEVFLVAWRHLDKVPDGDAALVWLYAVAYRVIGHQWRTSTRQKRLEVRLGGVTDRPESAADVPSLEAGDARLVLAALARLGETDAEVLSLMAWEQLGVSEIAAVVGISPNAVAQRLHRARRNLGRQYRRLQSRPTRTRVAHPGGER